VVAVSPEFAAGFRGLAGVVLRRRRYRRADVRDAVLAISATNDPKVNERVWLDAAAANVPVNVVDDPARCTFIVPAVARRGRLIVAISTGGSSPALAAELRRRIENDLLPLFSRHAALLATFRRRLRALAALPAKERMAISRRMAGPAVRRALAEGGPAAGRRMLEAMLAEARRKIAPAQTPSRRTRTGRAEPGRAERRRAKPGG